MNFYFSTNHFPLNFTYLILSGLEQGKYEIQIQVSPQCQLHREADEGLGERGAGASVGVWKGEAE